MEKLNEFAKHLNDLMEKSNTNLTLNCHWYLLTTFHREETNYN